MPANTNYEEVAAVCDGAMLAFAHIRKMNMQKGQKILINGASGSIGPTGVQLAKYYGAEVTAVCNAKNFKLVKTLGVAEVIDYTKDDFTTNGQTYDVVFDAVGKSSFFRCKNLIKNGGKYLSCSIIFIALEVNPISLARSLCVQRSPGQR